MKTFKYFIAGIVFLGVASAGAASGSGGWSLGANLGFINADQKDMNSQIELAATGASEFSNAWEFNGHITYRVSGSMVALSFRPSYFMYKDEEGTQSTYALTGFTFFPMLKLYMLESQSIKFYSQFGVGYGRMMGEIEQPGMKVEFSGGNIGYTAGLGSEFCMGGHCINLEAGVRFLSVDRFTVDSSTGTASAPITQITKDGELEINNRDFSASMSGVLAMVGYTLYF